MPPITKEDLLTIHISVYNGDLKKILEAAGIKGSCITWILDSLKDRLTNAKLWGRD